MEWHDHPLAHIKVHTGESMSPQPNNNECSPAPLWGERSGWDFKRDNTAWLGGRTFQQEGQSQAHYTRPQGAGATRDVLCPM